jgi:hypothetical protein
MSGDDLVVLRPQEFGRFVLAANDGQDIVHRYFYVDTYFRDVVHKLSVSGSERR